MKKLLSVAGVALVAQFSAQALAADLPVRTIYAPPRPVIYSWWTGCYVGGNGGVAWSRVRYTHDNTVAAEDSGFNPSSYIVGVQAGCQYQWDSLVLGVEATWSPTHLHQTHEGVLFPNLQRSISIDQIVTAAGRIGYAWDRTMLYVKGGWAGVRVNAHAVDLTTAAFSDFTDWSNSWTVGAGFEHVPWKNIIVGLEFNYYNATFDHSGLDSAGGPFRNFNTNAAIYAMTLRVSYLFGPPVVTNY